MNENEKKYIRKSDSKLIELIICNASLLVYLHSKHILSSEDVQEIESIKGEIKQAKPLLEILKKKENAYEVLKQGLLLSEQSGAHNLLDKMPKTSLPSDSSTSVQNSMAGAEQAGKYIPNFGGANLKEDVLQAIKPDLLDKLQVDTSNTTVITELQSMKFFNSRDIQPILSNSYKTQQQRMTELFQLISTLEEEEISACLTRLCNLEYLPKISVKIRKVLKKHYPMCPAAE